MTIKDILEKLSDDSEMVQFVNSLNDKAQNVDTLTAKVNSLENKATEAINSRQSIKDLVRGTLGVEEISEDNLKALLDNKSKPDEKALAEITNLKGLLEKANSEKTELSSSYESQMNDLVLTNNLRDLGIGALASTPAMEATILQMMKDGATREGDKVLYKNQDGTTIYSESGKEMTPNDKLNQLRANSDYAPLFKPTTNSGTGTSGNKGTSSGSTRKSEMSNSEKGSYIKEHGQEAYMQLKN